MNQNWNTFMTALIVVKAKHMQTICLVDCSWIHANHRYVSPSKWFTFIHCDCRPKMEQNEHRNTLFTFLAKDYFLAVQLSQVLPEIEKCTSPRQDMYWWQSCGSKTESQTPKLKVHVQIEFYMLTSQKSLNSTLNDCSFVTMARRKIESEIKLLYMRHLSSLPSTIVVFLGQWTVVFPSFLFLRQTMLRSLNQKLPEAHSFYVWHHLINYLNESGKAYLRNGTSAFFCA